MQAASYDREAWPPPTAAIDLAEGEVHLWRAVLDRPDGELERLASLLAPDEAARAAKFRMRHDRARFVAGRGLLREILGRYLGVAPQQVRFSYGARNKPALAVPQSGTGLCFNLAHSYGLALYAIACRQDTRIGVDLEYLRPIHEAEEIADKYFAPEARRELALLPASQRQKAFLWEWTCQEAMAKATGKGLPESWDGTGNSTHAAPCAWKEPALRVGPMRKGGWLIQQFVPAPGYVAALVVEGEDWRLRRLTAQPA